MSHSLCALCCVPQDPACLSPSMALLHYKGYHSLQTHRISHALYMQGHTVMALALQNRLSEVGLRLITPWACNYSRG